MKKGFNDLGIEKPVVHWHSMSCIWGWITKWVSNRTRSWSIVLKVKGWEVIIVGQNKQQSNLSVLSNFVVIWTQISSDSL